MSIGAIVRGAGSHRILAALAVRQLTSKELKNVVGAINGVARFEGEYMVRLSGHGFIERDGDTWRLTLLGLEKLMALGSPDDSTRKAETRASTWKDRPPYDPKKDLHTYVRQGSDDALKLPSRIGNNLYYRDGTTKEI